VCRAGERDVGGRHRVRDDRRRLVAVALEERHRRDGGVGPDGPCGGRDTARDADLPPVRDHDHLLIELHVNALFDDLFRGSDHLEV